MSKRKPDLFPTLYNTFDMVECAFGNAIDTEELPYICDILGAKLSEEMVIDVLAEFVDISYMELTLYVKGAVWKLDENVRQEIINRLKKCDLEDWLQNQIDLTFVPSYLMGIYRSVRCVFEGRIHANDYDVLLATLAIDMSFRSIAHVVSALTDSDYHTVLNDVYGIEDANILKHHTDDMLLKLQKCGYNPH